MREDVDGLLVFATVVEAGSFTAAARELGITRSAVSKQVAALEASLGVQLLVRTTRKLAVTDVGSRVLASSTRIAEEVERAYDAARASRQVVSGRVRLTAPLGLGRRYLVPLAGQLLETHPELELDLQLTDAYVDIVRARVDLALRVGQAGEGSLVVRKLARSELVVCASPGYLARHPSPRHPRDLEAHSWVQHASLGPRVSVFQRGDEQVEVTLRGRLACSDGPASVEAAVAGAGLVAAPEFELAEEVRSGALQRVLPGWWGRAFDLYIVLPSRRHVPRRVRTVEAFLRAHLASAPWSLDT